MNIDLIISFSFLILIVFEIILNRLIDQKRINRRDIFNSSILKVVIMFIYIILFLSAIMTWKLLWQIVFILGMFTFIIMFFIFGIKGYKEIMGIIDKTKV